MDRFIAKANTFRAFVLSYLKSSMDRFIAFGIDSYDISNVLFKIQYG